MKRLSIFFVLIWGTAALAAQPGRDSPPDLPTQPSTKPVKFLSAEAAIKTMRLPKGLRLEVVASEPMVQHPVAMAFDGDGRIWVVEMRSYMPDYDAQGEKEPRGRISILEDTNGDGRADKATPFMDKIALPRAVVPVRDGALVAVPPKLIFARDTDGNGTADEQTVLAEDYGVRGNPEHQPNGLMPALDNWIYNAGYGKRLRFIDGKWVADVVPDLGQWGITQDDWGRLYFNNNSDVLRGAMIMPHYANRNPRYRAESANHQVVRDQSAWPAHDTAFNRGYIKSMRREDGTLTRVTAACGPLIYRGGLFPAEYSGNAFICEPTGNLIKRIVMKEEDAIVTGGNPHEKDEFLTSTYERFRPVNLHAGPDGAIYIVDMHHGLIQHADYLTRYLRQAYEARQLYKHLGTGRIYRIVPEGASKPYPRPRMAKAKSAELVDFLSHPNGWWRDTAQRLLVERNDYRTAAAVKKVANSSKSTLGRLHALWVLEGIRQLDRTTLTTALRDPEPKIRAQAIRLAETMLYSPRRTEILPAVLKLAEDPHPAVQLQFALTIGGMGMPEGDATLVSLLHANAKNPAIRDAVMSGLRGRELEFLERLLTSPVWSARTDATADVLGVLSRCVIADGNAKRVGRLLDVIAQQPNNVSWRQLSLLNGFPQRPTTQATTRERRASRGGRPPRQIMLEAEPAALLGLASSPDPELKSKLEDVLAVVHWPGQPGYEPPPPPVPLTPAELKRFEAGKLVYGRTCLQCHKADGLGQNGLAPPLVDSEWVLGDEDDVIRIVLHGITGPITVNGQTHNLEMPGLYTLSDEEVAAAVTYVRREWDHGASAVDAAEVKKIRDENPRSRAWTEAELLKTR